MVLFLVEVVPVQMLAGKRKTRELSKRIRIVASWDCVPDSSFIR